MDAAQFAMMKSSAYFVGTARGGIHDEIALADALGAKTIAGAGLDVWDLEPSDRKHSLLNPEVWSAYTVRFERVKGFKAKD